MSDLISDNVNVAGMSIIVSALTAIVISVIGVMASRKKDDAQANAITSGEWQKLYDVQKGRVDDLEMLVKEYKEEMRIMERALRNMWDGNRRNIAQLRELDQKPRYEPPGINFRGGDDNSFAQRKD